MDTYGCINCLCTNWKCTQEELKNNYKKTQRSNINRVLVKEWPDLFQMCGIMVHFKELTGMGVDREAISSKHKRIMAYLISHEKKSKIKNILSGMGIAKGSSC